MEKINRSQQMGIQEVAQKYGVSAYTLRYYEKIGLYTAPRDQRGIRVFDESTLFTINVIVHYRRAGISIKQIQQILKTPGQISQHLEILYKTKVNLTQQLTELQQTKSYLDCKIRFYQSLLANQQK